jgi:hypothetical protein
MKRHRWDFSSKIVPVVLSNPLKSRSEPSSALNEDNDQDDDGNYEQEVDQAAGGPMKPRSQSTTRMTMIVQSMGIPFGWVKLSSAYLFRA